MTVFKNIQSTIGQRPMLALLVDPDKVGDAGARDTLINRISNSKVDLVLVGGSLIFSSVDDTVVALKQGCGKPVVLFPGLSSHFTPSAAPLGA